MTGKRREPARTLDHDACWPYLALMALLGLLAAGPSPASGDDELPPPATRPVDFERDIQPLFARYCLTCHDGQKRRGGLRLDHRPDALAGGDSGPAFEAGKSGESLLIEKVAGLDPASVMPPKGERLSAEQIGLIRAWIDQGANWPEAAVASRTKSEHWAFQKPVRPDLPEVKNTAWPRNPIDRFILARLENEGLHPSPEADRATLIRRLYLDLIGLPPTVQEVDAFVNDPSSDAYETVVDRLLASPHYGERWGRRWLDRARYADTNGYEKDRPRSIWPYRDWVIQALNDDMPFDRFTIEQIAGDLLPDAGVSQKVATGFHRNTMINEEGGIDVEEFRFASVVDRVATTGAVWLGLTIQCAQCHSHKFDPITQREYYQFFAFLNNADEPDIELPDPAIASKRAEIASRIARLEADLENQFPAEDSLENWHVLKPVEATSSGGAILSSQPDGSLLVSGPSTATDSYTLAFDTDLTGIEAIRLEALTDPSLPNTGPGRTPHGNFVLTEIAVSASPRGKTEPAEAIELTGAAADFSQTGFEVRNALDGNPKTGWAIDDGSGHLNKNRTATFPLKRPLGLEGGTRLIVRLDQQYGGTHTLGRFRISARTATTSKPDPSEPIAERRRRHLASKLAAWESSIRPVRWETLTPTRLVSKKHATMTVLDDQSVLVHGDKPNNDVYEVELPTDRKGITAFRLEVLPHESLPDGGPGRAPLFSVGDFILTEVDARIAPDADPKAEERIKIQNASQDYSEPNRPASLAIDGVPDSGWTVKGGIGKPHAAVFEFAEAVGDGRPSKLHLTLHQFGIHQMTIGRFRLSVTTDPLPVKASGVPDEIERLLLVPAAERTSEQSETLKRYYLLSVAPELKKSHEQIEALRRSMPAYPTTMVLQEREPSHARITHIHKRGEFLKPTDPVEPGVPSVLHPLPDGAPRNRLTLARWLVSEDNPLVGRVVMNRLWHAYFGRGLVGTVEDFGTRGDRPTHPELLDWLATEFPRTGWSLKRMHRLIVTSATYRQGSRVTPELLARDPRNELLARGPRFRVEAEVIRDIALSASGLLNPKIGGPSVFPPQPEGATALAYGQNDWPTSEGPDRYRRGLYTYLKRTAPYAAFITFDAPTSETVCVRRERSNTPLQALTLLNDAVFVEASQAMARRVLEEAGNSEEERARHAFRLCVARSPKPDELAAILSFHKEQLERFRSGELDASKVAGLDHRAPSEGQDPSELAAWTSVSRAILNLDETLTKE